MSVQLFVSSTSIKQGHLELRGDEHHYLSHVRRLGVGDWVVLFNGTGTRASAQIKSIASSATQLEVGEPEDLPKPSFSLEIAVALLKGDHMDQAITKMVELGVATIRPIITERTIVRLKGARLLQKQKRFESLVTAAARQSQNPHPATVAAIEPLSALLARPHQAEVKLIPNVGDGTLALSKEMAKCEHTPGSALVLIGPEGGFTEAEVSAACAVGFSPVSLGQRVMRAETACIAMASIMTFAYGDVGS